MRRARSGSAPTTKLTISTRSSPFPSPPSLSLAPAAAAPAPPQLVANTAIIITDEWAPGSIVYLEWTDIFHIADFVAAVAVLAPLHWSLKQLQQTYASGAGADTGAKVRSEREHARARAPARARRHNRAPAQPRARTTARPHNRAPAQPCARLELTARRAPSPPPRQQAAETLARLTALRSFYLWTIAYIYATRLLLWILAQGLSYRYTWLAPFLEASAAAARSRAGGRRS